MERTPEEWQKLFPVLEMTMTRQSLTISLADDQSHLEVRLPETMINEIMKWRQDFLAGTNEQPKAFTRNYTGTWSKRDSDE